MKDRLQHIIKAESLTNLQFAQIVEISPASVTHLLAGRNNPSLEIVAKIARRFPHYNLRWLILGEGNIYEHNSQQVPNGGQLSFGGESVEQPAASSRQESSPVGATKSDTPAESTRLIICMPDGTYKEFTKS